MGRLTADIISSAPSRISPTLHRELYLRGLKIPEIENLAVTEDGYDAIDLSDNDIHRLENLPSLKRLRLLLCSNNRIQYISKETFASSVPYLDTLILTNNRITNLADISHLASLQSLTILSCLGNPVTRKPNYRLFTIYTLPALRLLDFTRVRQKERLEANKLFNSKKGKAIITEINNTYANITYTSSSSTALSFSSSSSSSTTVSVSSTAHHTASSSSKSQLTPEETIKLQKLLTSTKTHAELEPIEQALRENRIADYLRSLP